MEPEPWRRKLTRSSRERMWAGVAGGLAQYFDVDPTLMRLMWVVATVVTAGLFVAVYLVMWVIMPLDSDLPSGPRQEAAEEPPPTARTVAADDPGWTPEPPPFQRYDYYWRSSDSFHARKRRSAGIVLIILGLLFLSSHLGLFHWINWGVAWAVVLIVLGLALLLRHRDWRM